MCLSFKKRAFTLYNNSTFSSVLNIYLIDTKKYCKNHYLHDITLLLSQQILSGFLWRYQFHIVWHVSYKLKLLTVLTIVSLKNKNCE
jgi:hypothetical protein